MNQRNQKRSTQERKRRTRKLKIRTDNDIPNRGELGQAPQRPSKGNRQESRESSESKGYSGKTDTKGNTDKPRRNKTGNQVNELKFHRGTKIQVKGNRYKG